MDIRILGPLEVLDEGKALELGGAKQRAVLSLLALNANRVVSVDRIAQALWEDDPPESARKAVQVYVSQLRKALGKDRVQTKGAGYVLRVEPDELDLARFERLRKEGRLDAALALWRGESGTTWLEDLRLGCLEERIERDLGAGHHAEIVGELEALVRTQPLRERVLAQLMLALYRSGRQADALEAYRVARDAFADELGIEPGRELRDLHQRILQQDPALDLARIEAAPPPPAPVATAVMRKTVTVLFCDLADSTQLGERLDPEALRTVMTRWYEAMRTPIERAGGTVEKFVGDAVMAVFGVPAVHEDDAFRAVRAAVEMRDAAAALELHVRIGVNTGEVVTGDVTTTLVTGDAVNTAKRLEEAASPGEILIGAATRRLVAHATELEAAGSIEAKGKQSRVETWRVLATIAGATPFPRRFDVRLVGRARELALLQAELAIAAGERTCRIATVSGPAGVGKSRIAQEFLASLNGEVLSARCVPYGDGITFLPLRELLGEVAGNSNDEIFWDVRKQLEERAQSGPLVVCIEDVHWAQPAFLDLIEYVHGWAREAPMLLLCLARPELYDVRPRWPGATVQLEPLTREESTLLLDELDVPADARPRIANAAEGNPLFLEQMVAMLADESSAEMPPTIHALLTARLDRLEPFEQSVLQRAAVVGKDFSRNAVVQLSPAGERDEVAATLLSLTRKELVRPEHSGFADEDGFRFRHALIRDAAYAEVPKRVRAELHERFADWLVRRTGEDEVVAYHLEQAAASRAALGEPDDGLAARAASLLMAAGRAASARDDMHAARNLFERALALADLGEERAVTLRGLAGARWSTGDIDGAVAAIDEAIAVASASGDVRQEWYARLERAARQHQRYASEDELGAVATEAVRVFGELGDDAGLCRAWRRLALLSYSSGRCADAAEQAERALEHARRLDDAAEVARTADLYCSALVYGPEPAASAAAKCVDLLAGESPSKVLRAAVASAVAYLAAMQASFGQAREEAARASAVYEELGLPLLRAGHAQVMGAIEVLAGDLDAAEREFRTGRRLFTESGATPLAGHVAAQLARVVVERGRLDDAAELVRAAEGTVDGRDLAGSVNTLLAASRLAELQGCGDEASRLADAAVELLAGSDTILVADALAVRGDVASAIELHEQKGNIAAAALVSARAPR